MDPVTKGPSVNQLMETSVPGIFACGNTVHVHDLVDYVTTESILAGKSAAEYAMDAEKRVSSGISEAPSCPVHSIPIRPGNRVRYTVPQQIDTDDAFREETAAERGSAGKAADIPKVQIMFRSTDVYRNITVSVYSGSSRLYSRKVRIVRPGEMQTADIPLSALQDVTTPLTVSIETPEDTID